jgi:hypothetical protein
MNATKRIHSAGWMANGVRREENAKSQGGHSRLDGRRRRKAGPVG